MQVSHHPNSSGLCCEIRTGEKNSNEGAIVVASSLCALCRSHPLFQHKVSQHQSIDNRTPSPPSPSCVSQATLAIDTSDCSKDATATSSPPDTFQLPFSVPVSSQQTQLELTPRDHDSDTGSIPEASCQQYVQLTDLQDCYAATSSSPSTPPPSKQALPSALRRTPCKKNISSRCSPRRVKGLWNPYCHCVFSQLHDDLLLSILSHLTTKDLLTCGRVCRRWRYCANHDYSWKHVHATDLVMASKLPPEQTSRFLTKNLVQHETVVEMLEIQDVQHRLLPDFCLPSVANMSNLCQLKLTSYAALTDSHVHAMLMSSLAPTVKATQRVCGLTRLSLEQCSLLTNKTVSYIALHCPQLQELSVRGNRNITNLVPLKNCWAHVAFSKQHAQVPSPTALESLFFALPATKISSPVKPTTGRLSRLDVSHTGVTAFALCQALEATADNSGPIKLSSLKMSGRGESWSDELVNKFSQFVDTTALQTLDVSCANSFGGSRLLTNAGLELLLGRTRGILALESVNLSGHTELTCKSMALLLSSAPHLVNLDMGGCKGFVGRDEDGMDSLLLALANHGHKQGGLERLSLWRCFPNRRRSQRYPAQAAVAEAFGKKLLKTLSQSPSATVLSEIDLEGCYFISAEDVKLLLRNCRKLPRDGIRRGGTKALDQEREDLTLLD